MAVELLLADSANLRKQLAQAKCRLNNQERQLTFLHSQIVTVRSLARQIDQVLLTFTAKLHFKEMALAQGRQIRLDSAAFHDLVSEVGLVKEKVQRLHDALEMDYIDADSATESAAAAAAAAAAVARTVGDSIIDENSVNGNFESAGERSPLTSSEGTNRTLNLTPKNTAFHHQQQHERQQLRKQISWNPSTTSIATPGVSATHVAANTSAADARSAYDPNGDDSDDQDRCSDEVGSESSQSLQDGILTSASAGMISLQTLRLFSRRSDAVQGPRSRHWFNRMRCCSFQECAVVIHLIYLHVIALVAIGGVTFLIVGTTLDKKEYLVAGTVLVIASYGLFLNHCFYRSATISSGGQSNAQKVRIKENASLDLEASTAETINIDLTRPPTRNILQVDLDSSQLSRAY